MVCGNGTARDRYASFHVRTAPGTQMEDTRPIRNGWHARLEITRMTVGTRPRRQESVFILCSAVIARRRI